MNDPNDAGGATNYGISLRFLRKLADTDRNGFVDGDIDQDGDVDVDDIKALTPDKVKEILKIYFWDSIPFINSMLPLNVKWKAFDISVHSSPLNAVKIFQKALKVEPDGMWGSISSLAISNIDTDTLLTRVSEAQVKYYVSCVTNRPQNLKFLKNWTWRAFEQMEAI